jgi:hypothetical protein
LETNDLADEAEAFLPPTPRAERADRAVPGLREEGMLIGKGKLVVAVFKYWSGGNIGKKEI